MSYQEQNDLYRNTAERGRMEMATREQAYIFTADGRADIAALGRGVVAGDYTDIDAVIAAVCTGPNSAILGEDPALLAAVQGVWPTVAAARYPVAP
jgi:uncharacterized membrane protein